MIATKDEIKAELRSKLTCFRRFKFIDRTGEIKADFLMVTSHDLVDDLLRESIKKRYTVVRHGIGYEISDRKKWCFPNYGTPRQTKEQIDKFPWE